MFYLVFTEEFRLQLDLHGIVVSCGGLAHVGNAPETTLAQQSHVVEVVHDDLIVRIVHVFFVLCVFR